MMKIFLDYLVLNQRRIIKDLFLFYIFFLLAVLGASDFASNVIWEESIVVLGIALLVILGFHVLAAYLIVWTTARQNHVSLSKYVVSAEYETTRKQQLKR